MDYNFDFQQDRPRPRTITLRKFTLLFAVDTQTTNALWSEIIWEVNFLFFFSKIFLAFRVWEIQKYSFWIHEALVNEYSTLERSFCTTVNSVWQTTYKTSLSIYRRIRTSLLFFKYILMSRLCCIFLYMNYLEGLDDVNNDVEMNY